MTHSQVILDFHESEILKNNPLHDPHKRKLAVYLPPGYETSGQEYPTVFLLTGFSSSGFMALNHEPFSESFDQRMDRLIHSGQIKPMIVVMPDCFTYYGGSQYLDSSATGNYQSYLIDELLPYIKNKYPTSNNPSNWAIMGKSSGGYGAMVLGLRHPELFGTVACHSGDMGFEYCYLPDFPMTMMQMEKSGGVLEFMRDFYTMPKKTSSAFLAVNVIAMAAAYSPNPATKPQLFDLPFDAKTGELRLDIWEKWLAWDPVRMIDLHQAALPKLKIFMDCGRRDEFRLYAGARMFSQKLQRLNIKHHYEEFDDDHSRLSYRYDVSLKFISDNCSQDSV